jgi:ketosteroid isomerase-like protein
MLSWLAKRMISRNMAFVRAGDYKPLLRLDAKDIRFRFPGYTSWTTELQGKEALGEWLQRFVDSGIQIYPDEVILKGLPWNATICVRGTDHLDDPDGTRVYENRYVMWGKMKWGLLKEYEVYEDTQASDALDQYLAGRGSAAARK